MSLHDVDKTNHTRATPTVNSPDFILPGAVKAHATEGIAYRSPDTQSAPRVTTIDDQVKVYDESTNRILLGRFPDGSYGLVIVKEGIDVSEVF